MALSAVPASSVEPSRTIAMMCLSPESQSSFTLPFSSMVKTFPPSPAAAYVMAWVASWAIAQMCSAGSLAKSLLLPDLVSTENRRAPGVEPASRLPSDLAQSAVTQGASISATFLAAPVPVAGTAKMLPASPVPKYAVCRSGESAALHAKAASMATRATFMPGTT